MPIIGRFRQPHECRLPVRDLDIPTEPRETIWQCPECHNLWKVVEPPLVRSGMQRVPDLWVQLTLFEYLLVNVGCAR